MPWLSCKNWRWSHYFNTKRPVCFNTKGPVYQEADWQAYWQVYPSRARKCPNCLEEVKLALSLKDLLEEENAR